MSFPATVCARAFLAAGVLLSCFVSGLPAQSPVVGGELRVGHVVTLSFDGPAGLQEDGQPNPFTEYRLDVTFRRGTRSLVVPGYFAADGSAADSGAESGRVWRVHFVPDEVGAWTWQASFVTGNRVAVRPGTGIPTAFDGASGSLTIDANDKPASDPRSRGMLRYVAERYLGFEHTGEPFVEIGVNSPENLLAYSDFDNTSDRGGRVPNFLHAYAPHVPDFARLGGGPDWRGGLGQGLLGALSYLAEERLNSIYVLLFTGYADGDDVWPWRAVNDPWRYDCSKLDQWGRVFEHATALGLHMQLTFTETENEGYFEVVEGNAPFADSRKLFFREMVARFGHNLSLTWNLGEENGWNDWSRGPYRYANSEAQRRAFSAWLRDLDPYDHPICVHTYHGPKAGEDMEGVFGPLIDPNNLCLTIDGGSLQGPYDWAISVRADSNDLTRSNHAVVRDWIERSEAAGHPWVIASHEQLLARIGTPPDNSPDDPGHDKTRRDTLWGTLMAGGQGVQYYFGEDRGNLTTGDDLTTESFRFRTDLWRQSRIAGRFFRQLIDVRAMRCRDELVGDPMAYCLAEPGEAYAVYLRQLADVTLDLGAAPHHYEVLWFDPRNDGPLQSGSVRYVAGPGPQSLGRPVGPDGDDWVALVRRVDLVTDSGCVGREPPMVVAPMRLGATLTLQVPATQGTQVAVLGFGNLHAQALLIPPSVVCVPWTDCRLVVDGAYFPVTGQWSGTVPNDVQLLGSVVHAQSARGGGTPSCVVVDGALRLPFVR